MRKMQRPPVTIISAPFGMGGAIPGAEHGPQALLKAGLADRLRALGRTVTHETVDVPKQPPQPARLPQTGEGSWSEGGQSLAAKPQVEQTQDGHPAPELIRHRQEIFQMNRSVAAAVRQAAEAGAFPLLIGGDHSVAMGSLAGLSHGGKRLGVIWLDAHGDVNTEQTSPTGNAHGMVLAAATGLAKVNLREIDAASSLLNPHRIVIVGARDLDEGEKRLLARNGIRCFTMSDVDRLGVRSVIMRAIAAAGNGTDGIHVSLDLDVLDPHEAPGVGTPVHGGFTYREARYAMELLHGTGAVTSMDIVEVNPKLDPGGRTAALAVSLAETMFGKRLI